VEVFLRLHPAEVRQRTKQFAIRIVRLFRSLPKSDDARTIGRQLLRSGTSVAANYRAVSGAVKGGVRRQDGYSRRRGRWNCVLVISSWSIRE